MGGLENVPYIRPRVYEFVATNDIRSICVCHLISH